MLEGGALRRFLSGHAGQGLIIFMKYKCPYCHGVFEGEIRVKCPACGKCMQVPDGMARISDQQRRKIKERIQADAERQRREISTFSFSPGRNPIVTTGIIFALLVVGTLLASRTTEEVKKKTEKRSPLITAADELFALRVAVERFKRDCGRYPSEKEGLKALVRDPGVKNWKGPYVNIVKPDPWKKRYVYLVESNRASVFSCGPDRKPGTKDDIPDYEPDEEEINDDINNPAEDPSDEYVIPGALPPVKIGR